MRSITKYLQSYPNQNEATHAARSAWSAEALSAGIVPNAISVVLELLGGTSDALQQLSEGVWSSASIVYRFCRLTVIGTETVRPTRTLCHELLDRSRESICICIVPLASAEFAFPEVIDALRPHRRSSLVVLFPNDLDALARTLVSLDQLIEYKLHRHVVLEKPFVETQYNNRLYEEYRSQCIRAHSILQSLDDAISDQPLDSDEWVDHPLTARIKGNLRQGRSGILVGFSASGKTILALQVGKDIARAGNHVHYLNLGSTSQQLSGLIDLLLFFPPDRVPPVFVIDDLQSNPGISQLILSLASIATRVRSGPAPLVMAISWKDYAKDAAEWSEGFVLYAVQAMQVRSRLLGQYAGEINAEDLNNLEQHLGDDLYLLKLSLELTRKEHARASLDQVAEDIWNQRMQGADSQLVSSAKRAALIAGSLGQFDILIEQPFLQNEAHVPSNVIETLLEKRVLRRQRQKLSMGHRSLSALIAAWLAKQGVWDDIGASGGPRDPSTALLAYLRSAETWQAIEALRALKARAGFKERQQAQERAITLVDLWSTFDSVIERIEQLQRDDPTWGHTPSSAMFATVILNELGRPEMAQPSLEFLRRHFDVDEASKKINVTTAGLATVQDFEIISAKMLEEDRRRDGRVPGCWEQADEIDAARFHSTWLLGLILCSEASAATPRLSVRVLAELVEGTQLKNGAFYPCRAPWCTARVLIGLAACGRTLDTSPVVQDAVDWLLRDRVDGGSSENGLWEGGTGDWNSTLETTSLVLLALLAAGFEPSDGRLDRAKAFLFEQRATWSGLDGAVALHAFLNMGGSWEEVAAEARRLSLWVKERPLWQSATLPADESLKQTCHVAQSAWHLISIGWTAIQSDLPELLAALDLPDSRAVGTPPSARSVSGLVIPTSHAPQPTEKVLLNVVRALQVLQLGDYRVVGEYFRFNERIRNQLRDRRNQISAPLARKTGSRENFLIWAPPGSGKSFFIQQIAASLPGVKYHEINIAKDRGPALQEALGNLMLGTTPTLCMFDEIDKVGEGNCPYPAIFPLLDANTRADQQAVFVIVGSAGNGLHSMVQGIESHIGGKDMLDRIPMERRFEIPVQGDEERLVVLAAKLLEAAKAESVAVSEIERFALYYVLTEPGLATPRQIRELAYDAVRRMEKGDGRIRFESLIAPGSRKYREFWLQNKDVVAELADLSVMVRP